MRDFQVSNPLEQADNCTGLHKEGRAEGPRNGGLCRVDVSHLSPLSLMKN